MQTTLLIMAAGIGSRFGGGIKQLEPVDEQGHIIMDYSIHDAIEAGFNKVVFIIRKDIENEFKDVIGNRIEAVCKAHSVTVEYVFQDINDIPGELPAGRTKPWGTDQAVLGNISAIRHLLQHSRWSSRWFGVLCGDEGKKASVKRVEIAASLLRL